MTNLDDTSIVENKTICSAYLIFNYCALMKSCNYIGGFDLRVSIDAMNRQVFLESDHKFLCWKRLVFGD